MGLLAGESLGAEERAACVGSASGNSERLLRSATLLTSTARPSRRRAARGSRHGSKLIPQDVPGTHGGQRVYGAGKVQSTDSVGGRWRNCGSGSGYSRTPRAVTLIRWLPPLAGGNSLAASCIVRRSTSDSG